MRRTAAAAAGVIAAVALTASSPAGAVDCRGAVVADYNDDGLLQGTYPIACLADAFAHVDADMAVYTDIQPTIQAKIYDERRRARQGDRRPPPPGSTQAFVGQEARTRGPGSPGNAGGVGPVDDARAAAIDEIGPTPRRLPAGVIAVAALATGLIGLGSIAVVERRRRSSRPLERRRARGPRRRG